ncbi:MAG: class I SAM-dependent methyltransferase [Alphaproteobacteria bacterium]|nr:MAG: class I SAM-dependent methyltransferase [Alphaproteobacteria bacterium]
MTEKNTIPDEIDFGFEKVAREEKSARVAEVFTSVADKYDVMNDALSLGVHRIWKSLLMDRLDPRENMTLLDVAGGTGDISFGFLKRGGGKAIVCDINPAMLAAGQKRKEAAQYEDRLTWLCGNAEVLSLPDRSVDAYTITFGIRNVTDRDAALREAWRVLKPGGHFLCLEFSEPETPGLDKIYDLYSFKLFPRLGAMIAGDAESYQYLAESIRMFPRPKDFAKQIERAGLSQVSFHNLSGGIATLYSAWRT